MRRAVDWENPFFYIYEHRNTIFTFALISAGVVGYFYLEMSFANPIQAATSASGSGEAPVALVGVKDGIGVSMPKSPPKPDLVVHIGEDLPRTNNNSVLPNNDDLTSVKIDPKISSPEATAAEITITPKPIIIFDKIISSDKVIPQIIKDYILDDVKTPNIELSGSRTEQNTLIEGYVTTIAQKGDRYYVRYITYLDGKWRGIWALLNEAANTETSRAYGRGDMNLFLSTHELAQITEPAMLKVNTGRGPNAVAGLKTTFLDKSFELSSPEDALFGDRIDPDRTIEALLATRFKKKN